MVAYYFTADKIGDWTGGGSVTFHEREALKSISPSIYTFNNLEDYQPALGERKDPWTLDDRVSENVSTLSYMPDLAHFYAGTWTRTIERLRDTSPNIKISYTCAAHDKDLSREEHERLGQSFNYPHLTNPKLWEEYLEGYLDADLLIVPSINSRNIMRKYGRRKPIEVIPHGCNIPQEEPEKLPEEFRVGYMGAIGPDKGLIYLIRAWRELGYKDATLVLAGSFSKSNYMEDMWRAFGGGKVEFLGWVDNIKDFYDNISLYVQPSVSEGFGLEVIEAMAHGRPVICSVGAGAHDSVPEAWKFDIRDVGCLAHKIDLVKNGLKLVNGDFLKEWKKKVVDHSWDKIKERYVQAWKKLLEK